MIKACLTIDDGPTQLTPAFVDYLNAKGITPVLYFYGRQIERHFDEGVYALQQGAIVGNHSYSHPHFSELSAEACIREIDMQEELLKELFDAAGVKREHKLFRFPFGDKGGDNKERIQAHLREKQFSRIDDRAIDAPWYKQQGLDRDIDALWTFDFAEYQLHHGNGFTYDDILKRIHDRQPANGSSLLEEGSHHMILIHDHEQTHEVVPDYYKRLIDHVIEQGVTFETPQFMRAQ